MDGDGQAEVEEMLRQKAEFCLNTGIAPSEYDEMTELEVAIFTEVHNERHANG